MAKANSSYEAIKNEIKKKSISKEKLEDLKDTFDDDIASVRLKCEIQTIDDLLEALEHRDVLQENKPNTINCVKEIINDNADDIIISKLKQYQSDEEEFVNEYAVQRLQEEFEEEMRISNLQKNNNVGIVETLTTARYSINNNNNNPVNLGFYSGTKKSIIYNLISTEIGRKWRDFGRALGIIEGEMDALDSAYPKDFKTKIYKMLDLFEESGREDAKKHVMIICNALETCRRKDLSIKVQEILSR